MTGNHRIDPGCRVLPGTPAALLALLFVLFLPGIGGGQSAEGPSEIAAADSTQTEDTVVIVPADGRRPQPITIVRIEDDPYLPLVPLARALGIPFSWDPYTFRGWIRTDSLKTRFTLASPVLDHDGDARQLPGPIRYDKHGVLIPAGHLELLEERWNGGRDVHWNGAHDTLYWGSPVPAITRLRLSQIGHQAFCRVHGAGRPMGRLLWSPLGRAELRLDGWRYEPESLEVGVMRGLISLDRFRNRPEGCTISLNLASSVKGVSSHFNEDEGSWEVIATTSSEEIRRGGFKRLESVDAPMLLGDGPVVLACCYDRGQQSTPHGELLLRLAEEVAGILSSSLGHQALILEGSNPVRLAGRANRHDARCLVGLRLDRATPRGPDVQVWTAAPRLRLMQFDGPVAAGEAPRRPPIWSETPELLRGVNARFAETMHAHLESQFGTDDVLRGDRPSTWLEGLLVPALIIYPANVADERSLQRLRRSKERSSLARSLAIGISEAIADGRLRNRRR